MPLLSCMKFELFIIWCDSCGCNFPAKSHGFMKLPEDCENLVLKSQQIQMNLLSDPSVLLSILFTRETG